MIQRAGDQIFVSSLSVIEDLVSIPLDPAKRMYWPFLLSSALLALIVLYCQNSKFSLKGAMITFFSRKYLLNKSSAVDALYLFGNGVFRVAILVPVFGSKLLLAIMVSRWLMLSYDVPPQWQLSQTVVVLAYTITFFLVEDLSRFLLHILLHKVPFLWSFHKVHHSAEVLTPLTLHRIHPVEMTLYYGRSFLVFGLITGTFVYFFGAQVSAYDILGVHALGFIFNAMGANLRHSHIWLSFGLLEKVFISPAQHQIHHSSAVEHRDVNLGTCLSLWDRAFGTLVYSGKRKKIKFGLSSL